ncbi:MAG: sodium:calcium antiporter [Candidatus Colwellbacteria bacterium]|nr:sodium:calcium antiporter [Candidatus Colwellbacteria bacterium]
MIVILNGIFLIGWIALLYFSGKAMVGSLHKISVFFRLNEIVVAFFVMATVASLPNLFVGISAAIGGIPQLSFGDISGGNVVDLTLALGLAAILSVKGRIPAKEKTPRMTAFFAGAAGLLPFILTVDGSLSRPDGLVLILAFVLYVVWIFGKRERFEKIYSPKGEGQVKRKEILKEMMKLAVAIVGLIVASNGIVVEATVISLSIGIAAGMIGLLVVGLGNALPETYMSILAVRKGEGDLVLGNLLGSVITPSLLVLGIVALIHPFEIIDTSAFLITRFFLIIAIIFVIPFIWTDRKISRKEGLVLIVIYFAFLASEIVKIFIG